MSRYMLDKILVNTEALIKKYDLWQHSEDNPEPKDLKGYPLSKWIDDCIVGWDPGLATYYLQCIENGDEEEPEWWLGTSPGEIATFERLTGLIRQIFNHKVEFEFVDSIQRI